MDRDLTRDEFQRFHDLIYALAGIHYPVAKITLLSNRIRKRLGATGAATFAAYLQKLQNRGDPEVQEFLDSVTTNETYFFRCERHWNFFRDWVRQVSAAASRRQGELRIWSAAASTGAEACTATIVLHQVLGEELFRRPIKILGTDLSEKVLAEARRATYRAYALTQTAPKLRDSYFEKQGDDFVFDRRLARLIEYRRHNLMEPAPWRDVDFLFLRNVMIYFDEPSKVRVLGHAEQAMRPEAYLLVGESESLLNFHHGFRYVSPSVFQKGAAKSPVAR
jgi:chemotaxis protein methyltransferase CheR